MMVWPTNYLTLYPFICNFGHPSFQPLFAPLSSPFSPFSTSLFPILRKSPLPPPTYVPTLSFLRYLSREFCFIFSSFARALSEKICFRPHHHHDENTNSILEKWYSATGTSNKLTYFKSFFTKIRTSFICADGFQNIRKAYFCYF